MLFGEAIGFRHRGIILKLYNFTSGDPLNHQPLLHALRSQQPSQAIDVIISIVDMSTLHQSLPLLYGDSAIKPAYRLRYFEVPFGCVRIPQ